MVDMKYVKKCVYLKVPVEVSRVDIQTGKLGSAALATILGAKGVKIDDLNCLRDKSSKQMVDIVEKHFSKQIKLI